MCVSSKPVSLPTPQLTKMLIWLAATVSMAATETHRPNLLFMMSDQQRHDTLGVVTPSLTTPNLDRIAKEGARFVWGFTSTPTCTPARAAILTGQSPWNHGMLGAGAVAPVYPFEMPTTLASLGYSTTSIGKDHFGWVDETYGRTDCDTSGPAGDWCDVFFPPSKGHGVPHGYAQTSLYDGIVSEPDNYHQWFEAAMGGAKPETGWPSLDMNSWKGAPYAYKNESLHPTAWVGNQAVNFIKNRAQDIVNASLRAAPWFLKVSFHRPHSPYDPPQRILDNISAASLRPVYTCAEGDPLAWDARFANNADGCGPQNLDAWCGTMPANESELARRCYQGSIAFIDEWIGQIFDALETTGQLNNTWMIWTADHGDGQSDHFHWRKGFPYEFASHVPFMIRWPEGTTDSRASSWVRGSVIGQHVVELRDIFPTFLDAAGSLDVVPSDYKMDGDSLLCILGGESGSDGSTCRGGAWRPWLDLEHAQVYNETVHWNALFDGEMKYIFNAFFPDDDTFQNQLFNLTADPYELQDLARSTDPAHVAEVAKWRARMAIQFTQEGRGAFGFVSSDGKLLQRTKSLVYSPNYPKKPSPSPNATDMYKCPAREVETLSAGQPIGVAAQSSPQPGPTSTSPCMSWEYTKHSDGTTTLGVNGFNISDESRLCIAASTADDSKVVLAACGLPTIAPSANVGFKLDHNYTAPNHFRPQAVVHIATGSCITLVGKTVGLAPCVSNSAAQKWVFGTSGRLCQGAVCIAT